MNCFIGCRLPVIGNTWGTFPPRRRWSWWMFLLLGTFSRWADLTPADSVCSGWRVLGLAAYVTWKPGCVFRNPSDVCVCVGGDLRSPPFTDASTNMLCQASLQFLFAWKDAAHFGKPLHCCAALVQCGLLQLHGRALTAILDLL